MTVKQSLDHFVGDRDARAAFISAGVKVVDYARIHILALTALHTFPQAAGRVEPLFWRLFAKVTLNNEVLVFEQIQVFGGVIAAVHPNEALSAQVQIPELLQYPDNGLWCVFLAMLFTFTQFAVQHITFLANIAEQRGEPCELFVSEGRALFVGTGIVHGSHIHIHRYKTQTFGLHPPEFGFSFPQQFQVQFPQRLVGLLLGHFVKSLPKGCLRGQPPDPVRSGEQAVAFILINVVEIRVAITKQADLSQEDVAVNDRVDPSVIVIFGKDVAGQFAQYYAAEVVACPGIEFALALYELDSLNIHHLLGWLCFLFQRPS